MNRKVPHTAEPLSSDWPETCTLYLLGELTGPQLAEFEHQLTTSPELGELLISQAASIDELSRIECEALPSALANESSTLPWQRIASLVALAACLLWALASLRPDQQPSPDPVLSETVDEALLIAKIWVDDPGVNWIESDILATAEEDFPIQLDDEPEVDSALSWMFVAVAADADAVEEEDANEG